MAEISTAGIVGSDGIVPVYDPEGLWKIWGKHEIYFGESGSKRHVPKVKDFVCDVDIYTMYIVDHIDPVTLIPTLRKINPNNTYYEFSQTDVLFGVGPGTQSDTYRVYLDKSVTPFTLAVDARLTVAGTAAKYAKIFKVAGGGNKVISKVYDGLGQFISENVMLEAVLFDSHETAAIKAVPVCYTTEDMVDNEVVVAVFYSDLGHVVSKRELLVENTSFIRSGASEQKYITHVTMESAFLSLTSPDLIEFPLNVPLNALNLVGVVHYSDGSTYRQAVDGNKFKIFGLDQFTSSIIGQNVDLVLAYSLGANETAYAGVGLESNNVTVPYTLRVVNPNNSYTVKMFGYPEWVSIAEGYRMKWYLYNLDRDIYTDVSSLVRFDENRGLFNPIGYGYSQQKSVSINLRDVSAGFKPFIHTQAVAIMLSGPPNEGTTAWTVAQDANAPKPYGRELYFNRVSSGIYNMVNGCVNKAEWLERHYYETQPLVDRAMEVEAPAPTHFIIKVGGINIEKPIADWNKNIAVSAPVTQYKNAYIRFVRRIGTTDMQLGMSALVIKF